MSTSLIAQESRRQQGLPVISALRGQVGTAISSWRTWCEGTGRACVISRGIDPAVWVREYVQTFLRDCNPSGTSRQALASRLSVSAESLSVARLTLPRLGRLCDQAGMVDRGADRLCRRLLEAELTGESLTPDRIVQWFVSDSGGDAWMATIGAIVELLRKGSCPALLIVLPHSLSGLDRTSGNLECAVRQLATLISHVPSVCVGLCASDEDFDDYLRRTPESYAKAALRESIIEVSGLSTAEIKERVSHCLTRPASEWQTQIEHLAKRGATPELVDRFIEAVLEFDHTRQIHQTPIEDTLKTRQEDNVRSLEVTDPARSAAERFLFTMVETTPDLSGLFDLNVKPGFDFGNRPAEIDLACLSKRIAIELDGYRHFTDLSAYRRDRRKDVLLQEHGFFVLRFLAEDVVSEMEMICETIRTVVQLRR